MIGLEIFKVNERRCCIFNKINFYFCLIVTFIFLNQPDVNVRLKQNATIMRN